MEENTKNINTVTGADRFRTPGQAEEIDLYQLWLAVKKRFWTILCVVLVCGCIAADITVFFIAPTYTSSSLMLVLTKETTLQSLADLQIGTSLTNDYKILIQSRPVLEKVIKNLDLDMTYQDLRNMITVTNQEDTRILQIDVETTSPQMSKKIVDELSDVSSDYIGDQMEITPPKIVEKGEIPVSKTSPSTKRNTAIGALIGLLVSVAVIAVNEIMNDAIKDEDDVERYLGLVTLANIPEMDGPSGKDKPDGKKRREKNK